MIRWLPSGDSDNVRALPGSLPIICQFFVSQRTIGGNSPPEKRVLPSWEKVQTPDFGIVLALKFGEATPFQSRPTGWIDSASSCQGQLCRHQAIAPIDNPSGTRSEKPLSQGFARRQVPDSNIAVVPQTEEGAETPGQ